MKKKTETKESEMMIPRMYWKTARTMTHLPFYTFLTFYSSLYLFFILYPHQALKQRLNRHGHARVDSYLANSPRTGGSLKTYLSMQLLPYA